MKSEEKSVELWACFAHLADQFDRGLIKQHGHQFGDAYVEAMRPQVAEHETRLGHALREVAQEEGVQVGTPQVLQRLPRRELQRIALQSPLLQKLAARVSA